MISEAASKEEIISEAISTESKLTGDILCVPSRSSLDEAAAAMLAQILEKPIFTMRRAITDEASTPNDQALKPDRTQGFVSIIRSLSLYGVNSNATCRRAKSCR
jgi:hypothetical protein